MDWDEETFLNTARLRRVAGETPALPAAKSLVTTKLIHNQADQSLDIGRDRLL
jgi:hypothetical protein